MFCTNCGKEIQEGSAFCPHCGTRVGAAPSGSPRPGRERPINSPSDFVSAAASALNDNDFVSAAADALNEMTGGEGHVELKFRNLFDSVLKKHTREEAEEVFACGSPSTTPGVSSISAEWPHPWLYSRVFLVLFVVTLGLGLTAVLLGSDLLLPGLMFVGSATVPFAVVTLFFETNAPRNISIATVLEMFFIGGVFSIALVLFLGLFVDSGAGDLIPSMLTGVVEEVSKTALIVLFLKRTRGRNYILTGILIGAAIGAGFDAFETAGYVFDAFFEGLQVDGTMDPAFMALVGNLALRAPTALGGHALWAAIEGGALALCDDGSGFDTKHLTDMRFAPFLVICIVVHGLWDSSLAVFGDITKMIVLTAIVWVVVFVLLQRGLKQINTVTAEAEAKAYAE